MTAPPRTGRPPLTSHYALLAAAGDIGFEGLTVGAVTKRCGVKYTTFYRYFESIDALVMELAEVVISEMAWPSTASWRQHLAELVVVLEHLMRDHPGLSEVLAPRIQLPPSLRLIQDEAAQVLVRGGFADEVALIGAAAAVSLGIQHPQRFRPTQARLLLDGLEAAR